MIIVAAPTPFLASGAIVVAGTRVDSDGVTAEAFVARLLTDGTLDPTFGSGGIAIVDFGAQASGASSLLVQYDGKLVIAGTARNGADPASRLLGRNLLRARISASF